MVTGSDTLCAALSVYLCGRGQTPLLDSSGDPCSFRVLLLDIIRSIRDPEKPSTLEDLEVVSESCVTVEELDDECYLVIIKFTPTVPHCSLATLIGLCLRVKLQRCLSFKHKLEIYISEGTHSTEEDINKQINDKERVSAAMENPSLREIVEQCVTEPD